MNSDENVNAENYTLYSWAILPAEAYVESLTNSNWPRNIRYRLFQEIKLLT